MDSSQSNKKNDTGQTGELRNKEDVRAPGKLPTEKGLTMDTGLHHFDGFDIRDFQTLREWLIIKFNEIERRITEIGGVNNENAMGIADIRRTLSIPLSHVPIVMAMPMPATTPFVQVPPSPVVVPISTDFNKDNVSDK